MKALSTSSRRHVSSIRAILIYASISCLLPLQQVVQAASTVLFGTNGGFDSGGDEAVCWLTTYDLADADLLQDLLDTVENSSEDNAIAQVGVNALNDILDNSTGHGAEGAIDNLLLQDGCYDGIALNVTHGQVNPDNLDGDEKWLVSTREPGEYFSETPFAVQLDLSWTLSAMIADPRTPPDLADELASGSSPEAYPIWFRLLFCNAHQIAYCHPFILDEQINNASQTDLDPDETEDNPFDYEEGDVLLGISTTDNFRHIYSRWVRWPMETSSENGVESYKSSLEITMSLPRGSTGIYFLLGHSVTYVASNETSFAYRMDIAQSIPDNVVSVEEPPHIKTITREFEITIGVFIGLFAAVSAAMFVFIVVHRDNKVLQLAQGGFLAWLTACSFSTIATSFLWMPLKDIYCRLAAPLTLIPSTMIAAILLGRLWRVYMTLKGASSLGRGTTHKSRSHSVGATNGSSGGVMVSEKFIMEALAFVAYSRSWHCLKPCMRKSSSERKQSTAATLRQTASRNDSIRLILVLSFPQIFIQIFGACFYQSEVTVDWDRMGTTGRERCYDEGGSWVNLAGAIYLACTYVLVVIVAWYSRDLPTAFNEKDAIFQAASINGVVCVIVISLMAITDTSTTSPNITSFLWICLAIVLGMTASWLVVVPKIRRVMSKEQIVVGNLLRRVNQSPSETSSLTSPVTASHQGSQSVRQQQQQQQHWTATIGASASVTSPSRSHDEGLAPLEHSSVAPSNTIVLQMEDPIPRAIESRMFSLKNLLQGINDKCLDGRSMSKREWHALQQKALAFSYEVGRVQCDWQEIGEAEEETVENGLAENGKPTLDKGKGKADDVGQLSATEQPSEGNSGDVQVKIDDNTGSASS